MCLGAPNAEDPELSQRLVVYLREAWDEPDLDCAAPPVRLHGGFDTRVYAFAVRGGEPARDVPLVLRLFPEHAPPERARREAAAQAAVADTGYPAPRVLLSCTELEPLGTPFLVMERLPGRAMLHELGTFRRLAFAPRALLAQVADTLADLMVQLHRMDGDHFLATVREAGCDGQAFAIDRLFAVVEGGLPHIPVQGIDAVWRWLHDRRPAPSLRQVICHCDLHPMNILMQNGQVTGVVDWANLMIQEPEFDAAQTVMVLRLGPVPAPWPVPWLAARIQARLADRFLSALHALETLDLGRLRYYEVFRAMLEMAEAGTRMATDPADYGAWGAPRQTRRLAARIAVLTDLPLRVARS